MGNLGPPRRKTVGFYTKCFSKSGSLCCKHVLYTQSFKSSVTQKTYHIFHDVNCKTKLYIYTLWNVESTVPNKVEN